MLLGRHLCDQHLQLAHEVRLLHLTGRVGRVFVDDCVEKLLAGKLDSKLASMAKYWASQKQNEVLDLCVQLHGGYGYMAEYPVARMWTDARVQKIYGGTNEIMKELIGRTLD